MPTQVKMDLLPLKCEALGGGYIDHNPEKRRIHIYGTTIGFNKANHRRTAILVKEKYPNYNVSYRTPGPPPNILYV